jgi:regulatory protein
VAEVRRRLVDNGYRPDLVDGAIERLVDLGMLDDAAFARAWVESRDRAHPRGARALRTELRRMGVPDEEVEAALATREAVAGGGDDAGEADVRPAAGERAASHASDAQAAARLLERRGAPILREPDPRKRRARAYTLLARNGFDPDVCGAAAAAWLAGDEAGPDE